MRVRISGPGRSDLKAAFDFIHETSPPAATAVLALLLEAIVGLADLPNRGRPGRIAGTRELIVSRTGHVIAYAVRHEEVVILRVRHGRQAWPSQSQ